MTLFYFFFNNFQKVNIAENETNYTISDSDLFNTDSDLFFSNDPIIKIDPSDNVIIPNTITFADLTSTLSYETAGLEGSDSLLATIQYQYQGQNVGKASITLTPAVNSSQFESDAKIVSANAIDAPENTFGGGKIIFINILKVIGIIILILVLLIISIFTYAFCKNYNFARRRRSRINRKRRRKSHTYGFGRNKNSDNRLNFK